MDPELKVHAHDNLEELSEDAKGGVTLFKIMTKRMLIAGPGNHVVYTNGYATLTFGEVRWQKYNCCGQTLQSFPLQALASSGIPLNTARSFLDGFASASSLEFVQLCISLATTLKLPLLQSQQQANTYVKKLCFQMFLPGSQKLIHREAVARCQWLGMGHDHLALYLHCSSKQWEQV